MLRLLHEKQLTRQALAHKAGMSLSFLSDLPAGMSRVVAVPTDYQTFNVRQWDAANRKQISKASKPR